MATTKTKKLYKTFRIKDPKTGKMVKVKKAVGSKTTNVQKGSGQANLTKNQLKAMELQGNKQVKLANIAGKQANIANIATQIGSFARSINQPVIPNTKSQGNDRADSNNDLANGGLNQGSSNRDDEFDYGDLVS